jgi:tetratricopeptide (TPR) repeat protein
MNQMSATNSTDNPVTFSSYRLLRVIIVRSLVLLFAGMAVVVYLQYPRESKPRATFQDDLVRVQGTMAQLNPKEPRYAFLQVQKAQLTGNFEDFYQASQLLEAFPDDRELIVLHAKIALSMHDVTQGKKLYDKLIAYPNDTRTEDLAIDIALQQGQYQHAVEMLTQRVQHDAQWSDLARYAYLLHKFGDSEAADQLYVNAQERLSAKQIKDYAWLELQRGIIDLENGKHPDALAHFELANRTYPGHWLIEEHLAETYALLEQPGKAIALYEHVIQQSDNPMYFFALGDLLKTIQPAQASELFSRAEEHFQQRYSRYPLAAAGHMMDIWIDEQENAPTEERRARLLQLSEMNLLHRPNADSIIQRIKVLILEGDMNTAQQLTVSLLTTPWRTTDVTELANQFGLSLPVQPPMQLPVEVLTNHQL